MNKNKLDRDRISVYNNEIMLWNEQEIIKDIATI